MIHEALNNCDKDLKLIIILNENEMSISKNIGSFASSIAKLRRKKGYFKAKRFTVSFIKKIPLVGNLMFKGIRKIKKSLKNTLYRSNYFEDMGLYYLGPADGNNYRDVEALLEAAKGAGESVLVHLKTKKGFGYAPAEENPSKYHGLHPKDIQKPSATFSEEFGKAICDIVKKDQKICAITAAMSAGTGLDTFAKQYPDRFFDVGIAEEHAVTFAAGLAANGMKPIFAVYSSFLQRSYDQMIHDVALQNLPVVICVDRAGFNNSDGATHHGIFDVAFTSQIPNFKIYSPITYRSLNTALREAVGGNSPAIIRYPSGSESEAVKNAFYCKEDEKIGIKFNASAENLPETVIVTHGKIVIEALEAEKALKEMGINVAIILCEYIAPYDSLAKEIEDFWKANPPKNLVFLEEEIKSGGFGMLLSQKMRDVGMLDGKKHLILAAENAFVTRKTGESYLEASGLDRRSIAEKIKNFI
jgi:1-deoxy-D-xylulose-5-phosphate synthase